MTIPEFIQKWNVAYENKEQQSEFAEEMRADMNKITADLVRTISDLRRQLSDCKAKASLKIDTRR